MLRFQGSTKVPAYRLHKASGQARVTIPGTGGGTLYLGTYGSPESRERYAEAVAAWLKGQQAPAPSTRCSSGSYTVGRLVLDYCEHVSLYYRDLEGQPTKQAPNERRALSLLVRRFETIECRDFGPKRLKDYQQGLAVEHGLARKTVNEYTAAVRRAFSWAVSEELVPGSVTHALREVRNLQRGRSQARETEPVRPVPRQIVDKTLPHLGSIVADVVRLQLMTGARPGEVLQLRPCDLDRSGSVWLFNVPHHKNAYRGHSRVIAFGPQAQAILTAYLDRDPSTPCFSPREATAEHIAKKAEARKTPRYQSHQRRNLAKRKTRPHRTPGDAFTVDSYRRAIARACERAGVEVWSPHRLRHLRLTEIRRQYGLEAAQSVAGHTDPQVTLRYAERDTRAAAAVMAEVG